METKFQEKLDKWLQEVANDCHKLATDIDLDFYVFQSVVVENSKWLIIGANPGGNGKYSDVLKRNNWESRPWTRLSNADKNGYIENRNNPDWGGMAKIMSSLLYDDEYFRPNFENATLMNIYYFNTGSVSGLKSKEVKNYCAAKTKEFINDIMSFDLILALGNDPFGCLNQAKPVLFPIKRADNKVLMKAGHFNSISLIWLPNPSRRHYGYYTEEYQNLIRTELKKQIFSYQNF